MTDLVTRRDAEDAPVDPASTPSDAGGDAALYEWAPVEPEPKKRRLGLWIGVPAAVVVVGLVIASLLLIAPGAAVAGVPVGGMTQGAAADAIAQRLADTSIELTGPGGAVTLTAAELGASVDADQIAADVFAAHPAWKLGDWFAEPSQAEIALDPQTATAALQKAVADLYTDPTNAAIGFDAASGNFIVTPAVDGQGVELDAIRAGLQSAFDAGELTSAADLTAEPVAAAGTTVAAQQTADQLNGMLGAVGFYVGDERTVPVDRAVAASWLTVTTAEDGVISVKADPALIQQSVDALPGAVNRNAVNATVITNSSGAVLSEEVSGVTGRALDSTDGIANSFAAQLSDMNGVYALPVSEVAYTTTALSRWIDVNLSSQTTSLYENGTLVDSYAISSGLGENATPAGNFTVFAHVRIQDMGELCFNPDAVDSYCTKDVPWVTYFAPNVGFHGTYWHNNFGNPMSHGCVNMPMGVAEYVYNWAPTGTEVSVHY